MAQPESRLLGLPAELRNRIWELVVISPDPIPASYTPEHKENLLYNNLEPTPEPALTRTNRQIRDETLEMYYTNNTFLFHRIGSNDGLAERQSMDWGWLKRLGEKAQLIRKLAITDWVHDILSVLRPSVKVTYYIDLDIPHGWPNDEDFIGKAEAKVEMQIEQPTIPRSLSRQLPPYDTTVLRDARTSLMRFAQRVLERIREDMMDWDGWSRMQMSGSDLGSIVVHAGILLPDGRAVLS